MQQHYAAILWIFLLIFLLVGVSVITHKGPPVREVASNVKYYLLPNGTKLHAPPPHLDWSKVNKSTIVAPVSATLAKEGTANEQKETTAIKGIAMPKQTSTKSSKGVSRLEPTQTIVPVSATLAKEGAAKEQKETTAIKEIAMPKQISTKSSKGVSSLEPTQTIVPVSATLAKEGTAKEKKETTANKEAAMQKQTQTNTAKGESTTNPAQTNLTKATTTQKLAKTKSTKRATTLRPTLTKTMTNALSLTPAKTKSTTQATTAKALTTQATTPMALTTQATIPKARKVVSGKVSQNAPGDYQQFVKYLQALKYPGKYPICKDVYSNEIPWTSDQQKRQNMFKKEIQKLQIHPPEDHFGLFPGMYIICSSDRHIFFS